MEHIPSFELMEVAGMVDRSDRIVNIPLALLAYAPTKVLHKAMVHADDHKDINGLGIELAEADLYKNNSKTKSRGEELANHLQNQAFVGSQYDLAVEVDTLASQLTRRKRVVIGVASTITSVVGLMVFAGINDVPIQKQIKDGLPPVHTEQKLIIDEAIGFVAGLSLSATSLAGLVYGPNVRRMARRKARKQLAAQDE